MTTVFFITEISLGDAKTFVNGEQVEIKTALHHVRIRVLVDFFDSFSLAGRSSCFWRRSFFQVYSSIST